MTWRSAFRATPRSCVSTATRRRGARPARDGAVPPRHPASRRGYDLAERWLAWPRPGGRSTASPTTWSARRCILGPDGNGIEIYRDRPREKWRYDGGALHGALPLDLPNLADTLADADSAQPSAPGDGRWAMSTSRSPTSRPPRPSTTVSSASTSPAGLSGSAVRLGGGYHHHLGLNTWHSAGSGPVAPGSIGLRSHEIVVPDPAEVERVLDRVRAAGIDTEPAGDGATAVRDPSGNVVHLRSR